MTSSVPQLDDRAPRPLGLTRAKAQTVPCGLCGVLAEMTKAHVPAQMAGNGPAVGRARYLSSKPDLHKADRFISMGRSVDGGLWMYGLCDPCNRVIQAPFELRYKEFVGQVKGLWNRSLGLSLPSPVTVPDVLLFPGAVARAVMIGMYAMNPALRGLHPDIANALVRGDDCISMPADLRLRLAIARGSRARISGGDGGFVIGQIAKGKPVGFVSFGSVYFPPLAWQLVPGDAPLIDRQGWPDVSTWLNIAAGDERLYSTVSAKQLPLVMHPSHDPAYPQLWVEWRAPEFSESVECTNLHSTLLDKV